MTYLLQKYEREDHYDVINDDADSLVASVYARKAGGGALSYHVDIYWRGKDHEIVVNSLDDAIPAVAAFYEGNPPQWEPESDLTPSCAAMELCRARYFKETQFGDLWVGQVKSGEWVAYRGDHALSHADGKTAHFATRKKAQHAADAHFRDGYPNSEAITDGLTWPVDHQWWLDPYRPANRARLAVA